MDFMGAAPWDAIWRVDGATVRRGGRVKQYRRPAIGYRQGKPPGLLNILRRKVILHAMRHRMIPAVIAASLAIGSGAAEAACYADYKAKRDGPLQLHYGVIELPDAACGSTAAAAEETRRRIAGGGWELLNIVSIFGADGLDQRRESAGQFYLRF
jgi:hypothetical protein